MKPIQSTGAILIDKDHKTVFKYLSDYSNDKYWRKEINQTKLSTPVIELGTVLTEDSFLSKRNPNYVSFLKCKELVDDSYVCCETTAEAPFWAMNKRKVEKMDEHST